MTDTGAMTHPNSEVPELAALLACPFCDGAATLHITLDNAHQVACRNIKCFGPATSFFALAAEAIAAWNTRATPPLPESAVGEMREARKGIYVASKVKHAEMWRDLRLFENEPIISTWIDELYPDDMNALWQRCVHEASHAEALIIYRRPDEVLKGAWIELGAALASGVPVFAVGIEEFTVAKDARIRHFSTLVEARKAVRAALTAAKGVGSGE